MHWCLWWLFVCVCLRVCIVCWNIYSPHVSYITHIKYIHNALCRSTITRMCIVYICSRTSSHHTYTQTPSSSSSSLHFVANMLAVVVRTRSRVGKVATRTPRRRWRRWKSLCTVRYGVGMPVILSVYTCWLCVRARPCVQPHILQCMLLLTNFISILLDGISYLFLCFCCSIYHRVNVSKRTELMVCNFANGSSPKCGHNGIQHLFYCSISN